MILIAVETNDYVKVYDCSKNLIISKPGLLHNYSEKHVAIKRLGDNKTIDIYNDCGEKICTYPDDLLDMSNTQGIII